MGKYTYQIHGAKLDNNSTQPSPRYELNHVEI